MDSGEALRSGSSHGINGAALTRLHSAAIRRDASSRLVLRSRLIDGAGRPVAHFFFSPLSVHLWRMCCGSEACRMAVEVDGVRAGGCLEMFEFYFCLGEGWVCTAPSPPSVCKV